MVESEAKLLSEEVMLGAVVFGHEQMQAAIKAINELVAKAGKPAWDWKAPAIADGARRRPSRRLPKPSWERPTRSSRSRRATRASAKSRRRVVEALAAGETPKYDARKVSDQFGLLEYNIVRRRILAGEPRIDGRDMHTVRQIRVETGVLPRTHGSALFTRGETQALVTTTLGTGRDAQIIDALAGERKEPFMLHYNFPPFSVGETGMMGSPKRREIGHGNLARRGVHAP